MPCGVFRWTLVYFGVYTDPTCPTSQVSRNFRESPEIEHDLQVSQKCYKISRNLGNLIEHLILIDTSRGMLLISLKLLAFPFNIFSLYLIV